MTTRGFMQHQSHVVCQPTKRYSERPRAIAVAIGTARSREAIEPPNAGGDLVEVNAS